MMVLDPIYSCGSSSLVVAGQILRATHERKSQRRWRDALKKQSNALLKTTTYGASRISIHKAEVTRGGPHQQWLNGSGDRGRRKTVHNFWVG